MFDSKFSEEFPFAPPVDYTYGKGLRFFIAKGLVENPEERVDFKHAPVFTIDVSANELEEKTSKDLMLQFFSERYEKQFGKSIIEAEDGLIGLLQKELSISNIDNSQIDTSKFSKAFHNYTTHNVSEDLLIKCYFMLRHPQHFLFRGAKRQSEKEWSQMQTNIEAFGTEYHPAGVRSPHEFWAEQGELITSTSLATPSLDNPFSVFIAYDSVDMHTDLENIRTMKYSWKSKGQPLAVKRQFAFLFRLKETG